MSSPMICDPSSGCSDPRADLTGPALFPTAALGGTLRMGPALGAGRMPEASDARTPSVRIQVARERGRAHARHDGPVAGRGRVVVLTEPRIRCRRTVAQRVPQVVEVRSRRWLRRGSAAERPRRGLGWPRAAPGRDPGRRPGHARRLGLRRWEQLVPAVGRPAGGLGRAGGCRDGRRLPHRHDVGCPRCRAPTSCPSIRRAAP
jgi:hypothetical protein